MEKSRNSKQVIVEVGPSNKPYAKIIVPEKRKKLKDRRKLHTYIANDLRKGSADRRRCQNEDSRYLRRGVEDRRITNTYVADDRRSGIADRRNRKRFRPPLWQVIVSDSQ